MSSSADNSGRSSVPKTHRGRRAAKARESKLIEGAKRSLFIKGSKTSEEVTTAMRDLYKMKAPDAKMMQKRNEIKPFEDGSSIEFLSRANDHSLFVFASHTKKRPYNLCFGRMFDYTILDIFEFGLNKETFKSMETFESSRKTVCRFGGKPLIVFQGEPFESNNDLALFKNFALDYFRGEELEKINLASLDRVIVFTSSSSSGTISFRQYGLVLKKSTSKFPRVELDEVGPRMDLTFRRRKSAPEEIRKQALRTPAAAKIGKQKNVEQGQLGDQMGRVHLGKQNLDRMALRKFQGLKKRKGDGADDDIGQADGGDADSSSMQVEGAAKPASAQKKQRRRKTDEDDNE